MGAILTNLLKDEEFQHKFRLLQEAAHETALSKGWWNPPKTFGEQLLLLHAEISEAVEEYRNGRQPHEIYHSHPTRLALESDSIYVVPVDNKPEGVPIELADLVIRLFDTCEHHNIDLIGAILRKMKYNETRSMRHGGKVI